MPNLRYSRPGENLIATLTPTVLAGTVDATYGVARLVDRQPYSPFKFTGTSGTLQWDLGVPDVVELPVLIHTNLSGTVDLIGSATSGGAGETYPMLVNPLDPDGYRDDMWLDLSATSTSPGTARRYWRLVIAGNVHNIIIGEAWFGSTTRYLVHDPAPGVERAEQHEYIAHQTVGKVDLMFDIGVRTEAVRSAVITTRRLTGEVDIREWYRASRGNVLPFPIIDSLANRARFVRWDMDELLSKTITPQWIETTLQWRDVSRGLAWN